MGWFILAFICKTYFVCKFVNYTICIISSGPCLGRALQFVFAWTQKHLKLLLWKAIVISASQACCMKGILRFIIKLTSTDYVALLHLCVISMFWTFKFLTAVEFVYLIMQNGIPHWVKPRTYCPWAGTSLVVVICYPELPRYETTKHIKFNNISSVPIFPYL
jgi:hypothetical protein